MPDDPNSNSQNPDPAFTTKAVDQPILGTDMRSQISPPVAQVHLSSLGAGEGDSKGFYQSNKWYIWGGLLGLAVIAVLSFLAFRKQPATAQQAANVAIQISAPSTVASGGDETYKIEIDNNDTQQLVSMQLELVYPGGQTYENSSPNATDLEGTTFPVPDLNPGQNAVIIVKTKVTGNVNDTQQLTANLTYQYAAFNSQFTKQQTFTVRLAAAGIGLNLTGPTSADNGQLVTYNLSYQNSSQSAAPNARVTMQYPAGFSFASANPAPTLGNNTWDIGDLQTAATGTIQIIGSFNGAAPGASLIASADFLILGSDGSYYTQNSTQLATTISNQPLLVTQTAGVASSTPVNPGDSLTYTLTYQNNATVAATAVNVVATLDSPAFNLSTIQAQGAQVNNDTITWNAASASQLQTVAPGQSSTLQFSVDLNNPATRDSSTNLVALTHVKIGSNEYSTFFPGSDLSLQISSPSSITANLNFVSGSNPPKVGTLSTYNVTITLRNATNNFSNAVVTAFVPQGGFDQGSVSAAQQNNVSYNASSGQLTWNVGALPAHAGQFVAAPTLSFNLNLNPSSNQVGQAPTLLKTITLNATDSFTQASVTDTANDLTTEDAGSNGGGAVTQ
jgi:uncharacterized repeat protein (TIGR01451 family)